MSSDEPCLIKWWRSGCKFVQRFLCLILALGSNLIGLIFPRESLDTMPTSVKIKAALSM